MRAITNQQTTAFRWRDGQAKTPDGSLAAGVEMTGTISGNYFITNDIFWGKIVNPPYAFLLSTVDIEGAPTEPEPNPDAPAEITLQAGTILRFDIGEYEVVADVKARKAGS